MKNATIMVYRLGVHILVLSGNIANEVMQAVSNHNLQLFHTSVKLLLLILACDNGKTSFSSILGNSVVSEHCNGMTNPSAAAYFVDKQRTQCIYEFSLTTCHCEAIIVTNADDIF
jgi:hypothetical protein